jgi:hypothetical protein
VASSLTTPLTRMRFAISGYTGETRDFTARLSAALAGNAITSNSANTASFIPSHLNLL